MYHYFLFLHNFFQRRKNLSFIICSIILSYFLNQLLIFFSNDSMIAPEFFLKRKTLVIGQTVQIMFLNEVLERRYARFFGL